jgi:hypothetical protein
LSLLTVIPPKKISEFVDFHLRQHVEALPSFIKDTTWSPLKVKLFFLSTIVSIVTKQSVGGILTERDSQISLQASMPSE